jgi:uncharacterized protein
MASRRRAYSPRTIDAELEMLLDGLGAIALVGAKAVGKTASASRRAQRTLRLDDPAVAAVVAADPGAALRPPYPLLLDEWQQVPALWDAVRRLVDDDPAPGRVLLTGSAEPAEAARPTHTGAGRIVTRRMRPMSMFERITADGDPDGPRTVVSVTALTALGPRPALSGESPWRLADYAREIVASGFPAIRGLAPALRRAQLDGYVDHLVTRDAESASGAAMNPAAVRRWFTAYAAATATTASLETLRGIATAGDGSTLAKTTAFRYRDALERVYALDPVPAWTPGGSALSRLGAAPKLHLVDPAVSAHLLGVDESALLDGVSVELADAVPVLRDGGLFGALFESMVALSMRVYAQAADVQHACLRTHGGDHEVDGILVRRDQRVVAYEVKLGATVDDHDVRHLRWLAAKLGDQLVDAIVVTTGPAAYRRSDGIGVVPAAMLGV